MKSFAEHGVLVLADISGFTAFVTATELEHGPPLIAALLEEVMRGISPPLEIQEVEGDAVFALGPDRALGAPARLLDVLEDAVAAFRTRQRELQKDEGCACKACRNVGSLDLKIVVHHGRYLRQDVGGRSQVAGRDVILAHRLLKNRLAPGRAYLLLTEPTLRWMEIDPAREALDAHTEQYEHLGAVRFFAKDLGPGPDETPAAGSRAPRDRSRLAECRGDLRDEAIQVPA
jgi:class 3 adenylate cyclase